VFKKRFGAKPSACVNQLTRFLRKFSWAATQHKTPQTSAAVALVEQIVAIAESPGDFLIGTAKPLNIRCGKHLLRFFLDLTDLEPTHDSVTAGLFKQAGCC
jgi:hypothetical protein